MNASRTTPSALETALRQSSHPAVRHLFVEESEDAVILSGRVTCYYEKQLAQEVLLPMIGVRELVNHVMVIEES